MIEPARGIHVPTWLRSASRRRVRARAATLLAIAITLYGALLRLDVTSIRYGPFDGPAWLRLLDAHVLPIVRSGRPALPWGHVAVPYVGGDPISYLKLAREMQHFYQASVREPLFLALTRAWLWALGGRDVAVSFASVLASSLAIFATYLLGAAAFSRVVGVFAAAFLAIEVDAISWSADGWRDDTFMLFVTLSAWRLVRLRQQPTTANAIWAGIAAAGACLTRITALSFVLPALVLLALTARREDRRPAIRAVAVATLVTGVLVGPYLVSCATVFGDPLYALNYHTRYYRAAEGVEFKAPLTAREYAIGKLRERPVQTLDTVAEGVFVWPYSVKWRGFGHWSMTLAHVLPWLSIAGLVLWMWLPDGRLLLAILYSSVLPYCLTWSVGGGGEWRFTEHTYPLYLVAAAFAGAQAVWLAVGVARRTFSWSPAARARVFQGAVAAVALCVAWIVFGVLPFFVSREALANGDAVTFATGGRDRVFFPGAWSAPRDEGNVTVRAALAAAVTVRLPAVPARDYELTLRLDPAETVDPAQQPRVAVFMNRQPLAQIRLGRDPARFGTYRVRVASSALAHRINRLELASSHTVRAHDAGPKFAWLQPDTPVAFRLWYVRLDPVPR